MNPHGSRFRCQTFWKWLKLQAIALSLILSLTIALTGCSSPPPSPTSEVSTPRPSPEIQELNPTPTPPKLVFPQVDGDRLFADVEALAFPRDSESDRTQARQYIRDRLEDAGWTVETQRFEGGENLIARQPGTLPDAGTILVGAHYDSVAISPGADDNASGVATVLELGRLLRSPDYPRGLTLVLFDREEDGLLGSFAYVRPEAIENLRTAVILEMTGYACRQPGCQQYPAGLPGDFPDTGDFLGVVSNFGHPLIENAFTTVATDELPPLVTLAVPVGLLPDLLRSDHAPFWLAGVGAAMVTDTANFRNPNYHRPTDTPDSLDRAFFSGSAQLITNTVVRLIKAR